ncbi:MAG: glycosyltransferase involved in cell wall biosynthesis [Alteromonadaceae bacterium]|jgi:glycosyltransferase involved in cell wall biosynthesis
MKTTLLYDHFIALGGAEKVSLQLAQSLPQCNIETAYADETLFTESLNSGQLKHFVHRYFTHCFPTLSLFLFYLLRYRVVDKQVNLLITGVFSPLVLWRHRHVANSVVYFHTFPSFIQLSFGQLRKQHGLLGAVVFSAFVPLYLWFLKQSVSQANHVLANSISVQQRFERIGIKTKVVYPGVDLEGLAHSGNKGYFLSTARLEPNKRVELIVEAFAQLKDHELHMVGGGSLEQSLLERYQHCDNIKFLGWQHPEQLKCKYNDCRALIYLPVNEYFGIAPVEAMAAGKPIIGVAEGGLLETINNKRLGILLDTPLGIEALKQTIIDYVISTDTEVDIHFRQQSAKRFEFKLFVDALKQTLG